MSDNMGDIKLGTLMAEVDLDTSGLEKGVERAEKAYGSLTKEIKKSTDAVGDFAKSIGKLDDKTGDTIGGIGDIITKVSEYRKVMLAAEAAGTAFSSGLGLLGIGIAGLCFVYNRQAG